MADINTNYKALLKGDQRLCVVGLGYVGLPLAVAFSKHVRVSGVDTNPNKIAQLKEGIDQNNEVITGSFSPDDMFFTTDISEITDANIFIVTVPTPITKNNSPNLRPLKSASHDVGKMIKEGDLVIFESTVYPGCTEELCIPILETESGLKAGSQFKVGYSPERINPGDKVHTLANTTKIVAAMDEETLDVVANLYELIVKVGVYRAQSLQVAEAAKVIENVQRDLNIALMNELSLIFNKLNINTRDVLSAAGTKWNFHKYEPGLVGGHCISVDPYYLTYKAQEVGYYPEVILSGRKVNDNIALFVADKIVQQLSDLSDGLSQARVLVMGVTFKENVRDVRNSRVVDLIKKLETYQIQVDILDPQADENQLKQAHQLHLCDQAAGAYAVIVVAVNHDEFLSLDSSYFLHHLQPGGLIVDIKGILAHLKDSFNIWTL